MNKPVFDNDPEFRETVRQNLIEIQNEHKDNPYAVMATYNALARLHGIDISDEPAPVIEPVKPRMNWITRFWQWMCTDE